MPKPNPAKPVPVVHNGNHVTPGHQKQMDQAHDRANNVMRKDPHVSHVVEQHTVVYRERYRPVFVQRNTVYVNFYPRYREQYSGWYRYGFRGGFYYPVRPLYDITDYFFNPTIFWLYSDDWDDSYYQTWYGSDYYSNPYLQVHFDHPGVFYPTEELRDLAEATAMLPMGEQANFRTGMANLVNQLQQDLTNQLGSYVALDRNDIVVTHYQLLETAVVLEGFVGSDAGQFSFKALLDLEDPSMNILFVPVGDPTDDQLDALNAINNRIADNGGIVDSGDDQPAPLPDPAPVPQPDQPPVVTPDPQPQPDPVPQPQPQPQPQPRRGD